MDLSKKITIYNNNLYKLYRVSSIYYKQVYRCYGVDSSLNDLFNDIKSKYNISYKDIINLRNSDYKKYNRIRNRIYNMDLDNIWFCTWTINDNNLDKNHRRKLKELYSGLNYVINVDYGAKNGRKHYHGILECFNIPISWDYGFCKFIKIHFNDVDSISKYINKFTNHALKDTTISEERILYSRLKKG